MVNQTEPFEQILLRKIRAVASLVPNPFDGHEPSGKFLLSFFQFLNAMVKRYSLGALKFTGFLISRAPCDAKLRQKILDGRSQAVRTGTSITPKQFKSRLQIRPD